MYRIDTPHKAVAKPTPLPQGTGGYFQDTDPAGGTEVSADWLNHVQEEIAAIVEDLGGTLDKTDDNQLADALVPRLTVAGSWTDKVQVGDPNGTGVFATVIDTEGGIVGPLFGYVETDKVFAEEGFFTGTQTAPVPLIDSDRDCTFRNVTLSSAGVDGIKAVASTGRLATIGDVYAEGDLRAGCTDLNGAGAKFTVNGGTGNINSQGDIVIAVDKFIVDSATGDVSAAGDIGAYGDLHAGGGLHVGYGTDGNHDPATVNAASGKVTEFWVGGTWSAGTVQTQTVNCDRAGADSIILPSVQANVSGTYQPTSCGIKSQAAGQFVIWAKNEGVDMDLPSIDWRFVVVNPV